MPTLLRIFGLLRFTNVHITPIHIHLFVKFVGSNVMIKTRVEIPFL
jgi:hypothetical protein